MIPVSPVVRENAHLHEEIRAAIDAVLSSGSLILGPAVAAFEDQWAEFSGARFAVGVASGLDALEAALLAVGVGPGDRVVVPALSAAATALAPIRLGATPVFADVEENSGLMDLESVLAAAGDSVAAVVPVALYGLRPTVESVQSIRDELQVPVVLDMAQGHGSCNELGAPDSAETLSAWSFYPTKNLGALGDGGAVTTNDQGQALQISRWRNYGQDDRYDHAAVGVNSRLDAIQAAVLSAKLPHLESWTQRRRAIAGHLLDALEGGPLKSMASRCDVSRHAFHQFVVVTDCRRDFRSFMHDAGVGTDVHYPRALTEQASLLNASTLNGGTPRASALAKTVVSIPCHPFLSDSEVQQISEALRAWNSR